MVDPIAVGPDAIGAVDGPALYNVVQPTPLVPIPEVTFIPVPLLKYSTLIESFVAKKL